MEGMIRRFKGLLLRMSHLTMHLSQSTSCSLNDFAQLPPCKYHFRVSVSVNRSNLNIDIINYNKKFLAFVYPVKCHKFCASQNILCLSTWEKIGNSLHAFFFKGKKSLIFQLQQYFTLARTHRKKNLYIM